MYYWNRKKGATLWNKHIGKVVCDSREAFRKFLSAD
jgi:hypothetical protein